MIPTQSTSGRLGRPARLDDQRAHLVPQPRPFIDPAWLRAASLLISAFLGLERPIRRPAPIHTHLPPHRGAVTAQPCRDLHVGLAAADPDRDLHPLIERQRVGINLAANHL